MSAHHILIIYYSQHGATEAMARLIARGVEQVDGSAAKLRTVPPLYQETKPVPESGPPYATVAELSQCDGLIIGSPTHFGNMAAPLKHFFDQTTSVWINSTLVGKPAGVFTSTSSLHGGQETTLISMMLPLLHHGMIVCGIPYKEAALRHTKSGGTPYGPSHVSGEHDNIRIDADESALCIAFGKRIAQIAQRLST